MSKMFKTKLRKVGTSVGILIPKEIIEEEKIKVGEEIDVNIFKKRKIKDVVKLIDEAFGSAKGAKPFERDRIDRLDRYE